MGNHCAAERRRFAFVHRARQLRLLATLSVLLLGTIAAAQNLSLPLDGYFRPGRCMPLRLDAIPTYRRLELPGAVPIEFDAPPRDVVPVLMLSDQSCLPDGMVLTALPSNQKLALVCGVDPATANRLAPQAIVLSGRIPSGPAIAWEALDLLIVREPLSEGRAREFVSHGVLVAVQTPERPANDLPWRRENDLWIVRPVAPSVADAAAAAYDAVAGWHPTLSDAERQRLLAIASLCGLVCLGTLLWRRRGAAVVQAIVIGGCIAVLLVWRQNGKAMRFESGYLVLDEDGLEQVDEWGFYAALRPAAAATFSRPVPLDETHARAIQLTCHVRERWIDWTFRLQDRQKLATLHRGCPDPPSWTPQPAQVHSPMLALAQAVYTRKDARKQVLAAEPSRQQFLRDVQVWNP